MNFLKYLIENNDINPDFCNNRGRCGRCRVRLNKKVEINSTEREILSDSEIDKGIILACQHDFSLKEISQLEYQMVGDGFNSKNSHDQGVILNHGRVNKFNIDKKLGHGIAIDIGTTTISMYLVDLFSGEILKKITAVNSQVKYGLDVFSRISYSIENPDRGLYELRLSIIRQICEMILAIKGDYDEIDKIKNKDRVKSIDEPDKLNNIGKINKRVSVNKINSISISANCIMSHIVCNEEIDSMGRFPYSPKFTSSRKILFKEFFEDVEDDLVEDIFQKNIFSEDAEIMILPQISAFIGGDIVSGIYSCDIYNKMENSLFIDIGTNGEIILSNRGKLFATSCATGPALEGMNIKFGMRASRGAIENFRIRADGSSEIKIIGEENPRGICGSGMLSIIREAIFHRLINKMGRIINPDEILDTDLRKNHVMEKDKKRSIKVTEDIFLSQTDIRQLQLSKAAIYSAVRMIVEWSNLNFSEIEKVYIAGQFGLHLTEDMLIDTGLLPDEFRGKISYVGNTSQSGAYSYLLSEEVRDDFEKISNSVEVLDLVNSEDYEKIFRDSMIFRR